jgi:hypothetical protein
MADNMGMMTGMAEESIQVHVSPQKRFTVQCPQCKNARTYHLDELGQNPKNPFPHPCPCGKTSQVWINYRKAHRKEVNLIGSFVITTDPKSFRRPCTVMDISQAGMRVGTELVKTLQKGDDLLVTFILNDKAKTKLELRSAVRQVFPDKKGGLILGLEFINLNPHQQQVLGFYMMT